MAGAPGSDELGDLPGAITNSPDPKDLRDALRDLTGWRRALLIRVRVPADRPGYVGDPPQERPFHFNKGVAELLAELKAGSQVDLRTAELALAEAEAIFAEPATRIESAERRATTLQGSVAIAASLFVGGSGLLIDPAKIHGHGWRIAIALILAAFLACLIGCALRALGATSRVFEFEEPGYERVYLRAHSSPEDAALLRAADLLRAYSVADQIAGMKMGLMQKSAWWFRCAMVPLGLLAGVLTAYAIADGSKVPSAPATVTVTRPVVSPAGAAQAGSTTSPSHRP